MGAASGGSSVPLPPWARGRKGRRPRGKRPAALRRDAGDGAARIRLPVRRNGNPPGRKGRRMPPPRSSPDPATRSREAAPGGGAGASRRTPRRLSATYPAKEATLGAPFRPRRCGAGAVAATSCGGRASERPGTGPARPAPDLDARPRPGGSGPGGGWGRMFAPSLSARLQMHISRPPAWHPW